MTLSQSALLELVDALSGLLHLVDRVDWKGWAPQQVVTGIATNHPLVVLEHLAGITGFPMSPDGEVDGRAEVLDGHSEVLALWLVGRATSNLSSRDEVVTIVLADGLGAATSAALELLVPEPDEAALARLLAVLDPLGGPSGLSTWPQRRPGLARGILHRARILGAAAVRSTSVSLGSAMSVRSWGSVNGVSHELQRALDVTAARAHDEPDGELREMYEKARERIAAQSGDETHRYDADA